MRAGLLAAVGALACVVACAGDPTPGPRLDSLTPARVSTLVATSGQVFGARLLGSAHVQLGGSTAPQLGQGWQVEVAGTQALDVAWRNPGEITLTLPAGLPPGLHDVTVVTPRGARLTLDDALTVVPGPVGLPLGIEDAPGGAGQPVQATTLQAGDRRRVHAVVRAPDGRFLADVAARWSVSGGIGGFVGGAGPATSAELEARTVGMGVIRAEAEDALPGETGVVTVRAGAATAISIESAAGGAGQAIGAQALTTDDSLTVFAIARDRFANFVSDLVVSWQVSGGLGVLAPSPGSASTLELRRPGIGRVQAMSATLPRAETGDLTVTPGRAASLTVTPATLTLSADAAPVAYVATGSDADGNPTGNLGTLTWSTTVISAIDASSGVLDPARAGTGTVRAASSWGPSSSVPATVVPGRAATLALAPTTLDVSADAPASDFSASASDADGNATSDLGTLTWSTSGGISAIDPASGRFTPEQAGSGAVRAVSSYGPSAQASPVIVRPGRAVLLTVAPDSASLPEGGAALGFTASGLDADGNPTSDVGTLTWTASGISSIDSMTGVFLPLGAGTGVVRAASSYGISDDSGAITVRRAAALAVSFTVPASVTLGQSFPVTMTIANPGQADALAVQPCALSTSGAGAATVQAGPTPASQTVAAGASATATFTYLASTRGDVRFTGCARGSDAATGMSVVSPSASSASVLVQSPARLVMALGLPTTLVRGASFSINVGVSNLGEATALGVVPGPVLVSGTGGAVLVSGPSPASSSIAGGGSTTYLWTYRATALGTLQVTEAASGTDANSGAVVSAPPATSNLATIVDEAVLVATNPFGDGSSFANLANLGGQIYLGPRASGNGMVRLDPATSVVQAVGFSFLRDSTGNTHQNSSAAPYPSLGAAGCGQNTAACGPDNENGRGLFGSGVIAGQEWLIAGGARPGAGNLDYVYMSSDAGTTATFRYVDLSQQLGGNVEGVSAMHVFGDRLYLGFPDTGGNRPYLVAVITPPGLPGLDAVNSVSAVDLDINNAGNMSAPSPGMIDALHDFSGRLYAFNAGDWVRADDAVPLRGAFTSMAPTAHLAYSNRPSRTTTKVSELLPADRSVAQVATWQGRLYLGRNTSTGPQLWSCDPARVGVATLCEAGDWDLVAANSVGDLRQTQFDRANNTSITLVAATASYLYVGFDNATDGVVVYRSNATTPAVRGDFEGQAGCSAGPTCPGLGGNGLGAVQNRSIFDARVYTLGGVEALWVTTGDSSVPVSLYRLQP